MTVKTNLQRMIMITLVMAIHVGCGGDDKTAANTNAPPAAGSDNGNGAGDDSASAPSTGADDTPTDPTTAFADVTAVSATGDSGAYSFSVTVSSSDVDCSQFANWWEVLSESGELLFRRILRHSHTDENGTGNPFTRSGSPVPVSADRTVVVRAHMNTVGYKGKIMRGSVQNGFKQDETLPADFAADVENESPQPAGCEF